MTDTREAERTALLLVVCETCADAIQNGDVVLWDTCYRCIAQALRAEVGRLRELVARAATTAAVAGYGGETVSGCVYCHETSMDAHAPDCPIHTL